MCLVSCISVVAIVEVGFLSKTGFPNTEPSTRASYPEGDNRADINE